MNIKERHEIAKKVYAILERDYPNYSKETLTSQALLELDDNLKLTVSEIVELIKPRLKLRT